ncbi:putative glutamate receptor [Trichinella sp. T9]|nr:putative glutamate receptor [Trichinella sp. T9]
MNLVSTALNDTSVDWIYSFSNDLQVVDLLQNEAKSLIIPTVQFYIGFWEYDSSDKGKPFMNVVPGMTSYMNIIKSLQKNLKANLTLIFYDYPYKIIEKYISNKTIYEPLQFESSIMIDTILQHAGENELISVMFLANASSLEFFINEVVTRTNKKGNIQWVAITANSVLYKKKHLNASVLWIYADYSKNLHQWNKFLLWLKKSSTMTNVVGILSDVEGVFYYDLCSICSTYFSKKKSVNGSSRLTGKYRKHAIREIPEIIREVGVWSVLKEIQPYAEIDPTKESVEKNHYRVGFIKEDPFIVEYQDDDGSYKLGGYCIDVLEAIAEYLNFTYEYVDYTNEEFGSVNELGRLSGLAGDLQRGVIDFAIGAIKVTFSREEILDFTIPHYDLIGFRMLAKRSHSTDSFFRFLFIIDTSLWICIFGAYFLTSFLIWVFDKFSPYSVTNNKAKYLNDSQHCEFTLKHSFWYCLATMTPQVWDYPMEDFYTQMYRSMSEHLVQTFEEGVELVLRSKSIHDGYIFIANESPLKMVEIRDCRLQIIGEPFNERPLSFAARRYSPIIDKLNIGLLNLVKERKTETLKDKWWNRHPNRTFCQSEVVKSGVISMESIGVLFLFLLAATIISALSLFFEFIYISYKKKH